MELIDQHAKKIMEECKVRARDAGLRFDDETLEYIVSNRDLVDLSPKVMIPTLYDYWVHDVEVWKGRGIYKLYPNNPYETVINTRPAISFYNDNNPDWMNIMIFYHVLGHIDFFQNNQLFSQTWDDDFVGMALADKRLIANLRTEHGRWVDYVIEFSRSIDNLNGYFDILAERSFPKDRDPSDRVKYYFGEFLQDVKSLPEHEIFKEIERYNILVAENPDVAESAFFSDVKTQFPEFNAMLKKRGKSCSQRRPSVMEYIRENSAFLAREDNHWMQSVLDIVRNSALYFEPQIRSKIANEGWASYWHDTLFRMDDRIKGHEVAFGITNAAVTSISRIGLNPYAIGLRLLQHIENLGDRGKMSYYFQKIHGIEQRDDFNQSYGQGKQAIFDIRSKFSDFMLINTFVDQDFVDEYDLFVVGKRQNQQRGTIEYYIKSRRGEDYKQMLLNTLYHPPKINVDESKTTAKNLYLVHAFEGKQLYQGFIPDTLIGIEYLWGGQVSLETTEIVRVSKPDEAKQRFALRPVLYVIKDRKVTKQNI